MASHLEVTMSALWAQLGFLLVFVHAQIPTTLDGPFNPTVPLDKSFRGHAVDLSDTDPRPQRTVKGFEPQQISVSLSSTCDSVWISWISTGGESVAENCQILQTRVNRFKSDKDKVDATQLRGYSCDIKFTGVKRSSPMSLEWTGPYVVLTVGLDVPIFTLLVL
ncbi:uncharacterized protein LOC127791157 isoform X5 [Diospyros lotus]|uniref:uncharacterized protein LOC127791157 isoform X5 n=1 Tax=Diospyros lotus TaxID=55363 RepID=UPI002252A0A1|nr:uncharacterized protein LOC127791157 isoform X5 [Diospyros lotus]